MGNNVYEIQYIMLREDMLENAVLESRQWLHVSVTSPENEA